MTAKPRARLGLPSAPRLVHPEGVAERLVAAGVNLTEAQLGLVGDYLARLLAMNERMNLTAIVDPAEAWTRHAEDALSLVPMLAELPKGARVADVGSGGGVPGIPLAIAFPDLPFSLIESTRKKAGFLQDMARALDLRNVTVLPERAEYIGESRMRGTFDAVTARAVSKLSLLVPLTAPLLRDGGRLLFIKGQRADEELVEAEAALRASHVIHCQTLSTPTGRVVVLEKVARGA